MGIAVIPLPPPKHIQSGSRRDRWNRSEEGNKNIPSTFPWGACFMNNKWFEFELFVAHNGDYNTSLFLRQNKSNPALEDRVRIGIVRAIRKYHLRFTRVLSSWTINDWNPKFSSLKMGIPPSPLLPLFWKILKSFNLTEPPHRACFVDRLI